MTIPASPAASPADFSYPAAANDAAGVQLALSLFGNCPALLAQLREDAEAAGLRVAHSDGLLALHEGAARPLGDVVIVDCPQVDGASLAALARLDLRARETAAQLVVFTSLAALDDVFGCLDQSAPQILVNAGRAERLVALGRAIAGVPGRRLRELSEEDRLALINLTEQVTRIAQRLDRFDGGPPTDSADDGGAFRFESPRPAFVGAAADGSARLVRAARPPLPDPRLVRRIIRQRQLRARYFDGDLFADPAWDMLLDLAAARAEHTRVSVTSLCIASGVPPTTALRWITQMTEAGLLERIDDETDRRRAFIALSDKATDAIARYFAELGTTAARLV